MEYPEILLPQPSFKQIEEDCFVEAWLCRTAPPNSQNMSKAYVPESVFYQKWEEFYDYSTNLLGHFEYNHNYISLCGESEGKRYFQGYWDFSEIIDPPKYPDNFEINSSKSIFFIPINQIHQQVKIPFLRPPKNHSDQVTAKVVHTPTRSNFWHFSIQWVDNDNKIVKPSDSKWKEERIAAMRAAFSECLTWELPVHELIPTDCYTK